MYLTPSSNHELKMYRIALILGFILYPFFGYVYSDYYFHFTFDGLWERSGVGLLSGVCLAISYHKKAPMTLLRCLVLIAAVTLTLQFFYFAKLSNYHWFYLIGLIQVPILCIVVFYRKIDAIIYFVLIVLWAQYVFVDSPFKGNTYPVFISTFMLIYYVYFSNRENLMLDLRNKIDEIYLQQVQIDDKNNSLIKIGELATQVAHDIRSPVTALQAVSQMLGDEIDPKKKKLIENAAKRINDIANNLVSEYKENLTKDLSSMIIDRTINLNSLIEDVIEEKKLSLDINHRLNLKAPESIAPPQKFDSVEFQRVISNLINNSIESFDKANGIVDVELCIINNQIRITIRDNGRGIPDNEIFKVFEKGVSTKSKGLGLGLGHAKEYIESTGGSIDIASTLGKETMVSIFMNIGENPGRA
jgi:signal transduction histidine kinase